jgi:CDP-diacylglycerol--serine O-phosphatidyltransferase
MTQQTPPPERPRRPLRRAILRSTAALPAMVTLMNGVAGFASIYYATLAGCAQPSMEPNILTTAAWLIFLAMGFDALDGRLARMTRRVTDFGAQLDSLCDVISFGVAPAVLMCRTFQMLLGRPEYGFLQPASPGLIDIMLGIGVVYVCCAVLRLARFNVENAPDLLHHLSFKGLPSPGAAATVAGMVILANRLQSPKVGGWQALDWINVAVGVTLPLATLAVALLMVSRFRYPHLMNKFIRGKRPVSYIVKAMIVVVAAVYLRVVALALVPLLYALSSPASELYRRARGKAPAARQAPPPAVRPPA